MRFRGSARFAALLLVRLLALVALHPLPAAWAEPGGHCAALLTVPEYQLELPLIGAVRSQCGGTCWLNASLTTAEHVLHARTGERVPLAADYYMALALRKRITTPLWEGRLELPTLDKGGDFWEALRLLNEHGLVPQAEYRAPKLDVDALAYKLHAAAKTVLPKKPAFDPSRNRARIEQAVRAIDQVIESEIGKYVPRTIALKQRRLSPVEAAQAHVEFEHFEEIKPKHLLPRFTLAKGLSFEKMYPLIKRKLAQGKAVYASLKWASDWRSSDLVTLNAVASAPGAAEQAGAHAIVIVGTSSDSKGNVVALKLQNSWGAEAGEGGFVHLSREAFEQSLQTLIVRK